MLGMKASRVTVGFLIVSFIAVSVFGVWVMNHGGEGHGGCIGADVMNGVCPSSNPIAFISFHLRAFLRFSTAVFGALALASIILLVALRNVHVSVPSALRRLWHSRLRVVRAVNIRARASSRIVIMRWLSLLERRDPSLAFVPFAP